MCGRCFDVYPSALRADLLALRALIFATARETEGVGASVETLKWGQPAYLPVTPRVGSTIRIDALKAQEGRYALYVHCQTSLLAHFRELYADTFVYQGNRCLVFSQGEKVPRDALQHCIALALTYHAARRGT